MARYVLYATGPDNRSTYPECWGAAGRSRGRYITAADTLPDLIPAVNRLGHDNFWIRAANGRCMAGNRKDFYALPAIRKVVDAAERAI